MKIKQIENISLEWIVENSNRNDLYVIRFTKENYNIRSRKESHPYGISLKLVANMKISELKKEIENGLCVVQLIK